MTAVAFVVRMAVVSIPGLIRLPVVISIPTSRAAVVTVIGQDITQHAARCGAAKCEPGVPLGNDGTGRRSEPGTEHGVVGLAVVVRRAARHTYDDESHGGQFCDAFSQRHVLLLLLYMRPG